MYNFINHGPEARLVVSIPEPDEPWTDEGLLPFSITHHHGPMGHASRMLNQTLHPSQGHSQLDQPHTLQQDIALGGFMCWIILTLA